MKYAILALFFCIIGQNAKAQSPTYETFDFIYIDNSRTTAEDGLSQQQIDDIEALAAEIAQDENRLLIVYASNGNNPRITTDAEKISTWLNNLLQNNTPFPGDKFAEKKQIRDALYGSIIEVSSKVNFHFFITDQYAASLEDQHSAMIAMLTNEFVQTLDFEGKAISNIYINNKQKVDMNKIRQSLMYNINHDDDKRKPLEVNVNFNIIETKS